MAENYFAQRASADDSPIPKGNAFAQRQAELDQEEAALLPVSSELEQAFGPNDMLTAKSPAEHAQTAASEGISWVSDRIVDMGFTVAKALIPDDWEDAIVDYGEAKWAQMLKDPQARRGIELAKQGLESYQEWADENPNTSRRLEEVINISAVSPQKITAAALGDYPKLEKRVAANAQNNRRGQVTEMMEPIGKKGEGTLRINPSTKQKEYVPTRWEVEVNDVVTRTPGVDPKAPFTDNMNAVRESAGKMRKDLDAMVEASGGTFSKKGVLNGLATKVNNLEKTTLLSGNALDMGVKIYGRAKDLIEATDGSAVQLLQARRDLDKWVTGQRKTFNSDFESATGIALREVRDYMNDAVADATGSAKVKESLHKQHKLLTAGDALESKALREADGRIGRMIQKWEDKTGGKVPTTPLAQAASAVYLGSKAAIVAPIGALFAGYRGLKWLVTAEGKLWLNQLKDVAKQNPFLKPEVNGLVQLANGLGPTEE